MQHPVEIILVDDHLSNKLTIYFTIGIIKIIILNKVEAYEELKKNQLTSRTFNSRCN